MRIRLIWRRALLVAALVTLVFALAPAMSHTVVHATTTGTLTAAPSAVAPGGTVVITGYGTGYGSGYLQQQQVYLNISPAFPGTTGIYAVTTTDIYGSFSFTYSLVVPANATIGQTYDANVSVTNSTPTTYVHASFTVGSSSGANITISPTSMVPGSAFTVTGSGFTGSGQTVTLQFGTLAMGSRTVTETASGTFVAYSNYLPLGAAAGNYTVTATENYVASGTTVAKSAVATLYVTGAAGTISAAITMNPLSTPTTAYVTPGSLVTVTGINFSGIGSVYLTCSALSVSQTLGNPSFSTSFTVPSTTALGTYTLTASDNYRNTYTTIIVQSTTSATGTTLVNTPSAAAPGQTITVTGVGYTAGATVTISGLYATFTAVATTSGTISTTIVIPSTQPTGTVTLSAQDAYGHAATTTQTIGTAGITVTGTPSSSAVGAVIAVSGTSFGANEVVTVGLATSSTTPSFIAGTTSTYTANSTGGFSGSYTVPNLGQGTYYLFASGNTSRIQATSAFVITGVAATATSTPLPVATAGTVPFPTIAATSTPVVGPLAAAPSTATTTYFAEGYTGTAATNGQATFTEKLYLFNAGPVASNVTTTYYVYDTTKNTHTTVVEHDTVAPGVTAVRAVNTDAGNDRNVSIVVQASAGISAETVISRVAKDGTILDTGSSKGSAALNQTWYLAEGYTGASIQEYLTIFNPGSTDAHTQVRYMPSDATAPAAQAVTVPAGGRTTINVRSVYNGLVKKGSRNVGISVTSDQAIAVDRAMYWGDGSGSGKYGYSVGPGINSGQTLQYFSYLPTSSGSQSFVTVLNTSSGTATVALSLRDSFGGSIVPVQLSIGAGQRATFSLPTLVSSSFGVITGILSSNTPVVAEAGIYFNGSPNIGRHPGTVVQGTTGTPLGARANVATTGAQLRIVNVSGSLIRVQVLSKGAGTSNVLYDTTISNRNAKTVIIPAGTDPRSIQVLGSGTFSATLINGGDGSSTAWGGNLN